MNANVRRLLVVDDDPVIGKSFDRALAGKGYAVITARDGSEALEKLRNEQYDAVYTDIRMPGMDGVEVARRVKAARPWTPVVIVTGYGTTENIERAWAAGVSAFLRKPLSPEMIEDSAKAVTAVAAPTIESAVPAAGAAAPVAAGRTAKNVALFLAAPLIGLAYVVALPFAGLAALAWALLRRAYGLPRVRRALEGAKNVALFVGAPFIGLAYVIAAPFVGLVALARYGKRAIFGQREQ